jgi:hypothetical protein
VGTFLYICIERIECTDSKLFGAVQVLRDTDRRIAVVRIDNKHVVPAFPRAKGLFPFAGSGLAIDTTEMCGLVLLVEISYAVDLFP